MRVETIGDATLYLGDCREVLPALPPVDTVVTDPPYAVTDNSWDTPIDLDIFWSLVWKCTKQNAAICVFSQQPFTSQLILSNKQYFRYDLVWMKRKYTGFLNAKKMPLRAHENICVFYRKLPIYHPQKFYRDTPSYRGPGKRASVNYSKYVENMDTGLKDGSRYPLSIIDVEYESIFFKKAPYPMHPTQKTVQIMQYLIKTYSNSGDTILDQFMGSGTTGVAAVALGRKFIGIEQDSAYFDTCCRRIEEVVSRPPLLKFAANDNPPQQEQLPLEELCAR